MYTISRAGKTTFTSTASAEMFPLDHHRSYLYIKNTSTATDCVITIAPGAGDVVDNEGIVLKQNEVHEMCTGLNNICIERIAVKVAAGASDPTKACLSYLLGRNTIPGAPA